MEITLNFCLCLGEHTISRAFMAGEILLYFTLEFLFVKMWARVYSRHAMNDERNDFVTAVLDSSNGAQGEATWSDFRSPLFPHVDVCPWLGAYCFFHAYLSSLQGSLVRTRMKADLLLSALSMLYSCCASNYSNFIYIY